MQQISYLIKFVLICTLISIHLTYAQSVQDGNLNACKFLNLKTINKPIDDSIKQIIVVTYISGSKAKVYPCQKVNQKWDNTENVEFNALIGKNGLAKIGKKYEGDLKTPAGFYPIGDLFGYHHFKTNMKYRLITNNDKFIDDPNSREYNSWVSGDTDAETYEDMLLRNNTYELGAVINYNMAPTIPYKGSAIFLHIWKNPTYPTVGCVAMSKNNLYTLLKWLNYNDKPHILIIKNTDLLK